MVYFENRRSRYGFGSGVLLEAVAVPSIRREVLLQLEQMRRIGVNEITYELRSENPFGPNEPVGCEDASSTWINWPTPSVNQLRGLRLLLDLAHQKGMRFSLFLNNLHMEAPRSVNEGWLGPILLTLRDEPAFDYVAFGGDAHLNDFNGDGIPETCGSQAEAPLWFGPDSLQGQYVEWAIRYGLSLGLKPGQLTAEAIVGWLYPPDQWYPPQVLRTILDRIGIPVEQRTYALSWYLHRRCDPAQWAARPPCSDVDAYTWGTQSVERALDALGEGHAGPHRARIIFAEYGRRTNETGPPTELATEYQGALMQRYGIEGGSFWLWTDWSLQAVDIDSVKKRGFAWNYNPVAKELADLYGLHLVAVPNGSFEGGAAEWSVAGLGSVEPRTLDEVAPSRGQTYLHLETTGSLAISSPLVSVSASTTYTTTANLRFSWSGDPRPKASAAKRPHVYLSFRYLTCARTPSRVRRDDTVRYTANQRTRGFATFPIRYTTPKDACFVAVAVGAERNGLRQPIILDVDNVR
jgi:hypothetical protein